MGLFTQQAIKSGQGSEDVKRFFKLVSSLFAIKERCPVVPGTSENPEELIAEIKAIDKRCNFLNMLSAIRVAVDSRESQKLKQGYYILIQSVTNQTKETIYTNS